MTFVWHAFGEWTRWFDDNFQLSQCNGCIHVYTFTEYKNTFFSWRTKITTFQVEFERGHQKCFMSCAIVLKLEGGGYMPTLKFKWNMVCCKATMDVLYNCCCVYNQLCVTYWQCCLQKLGCTMFMVWNLCLNEAIVCIDIRANIKRFMLGQT